MSCTAGCCFNIPRKAHDGITRDAGSWYRHVIFEYLVRIGAYLRGNADVNLALGDLSSPGVVAGGGFFLLWVMG